MENEIAVGYSQRTTGANGLITSADCIGLPSVVAVTAGIFAPNCYLYQRDSSTSFRTVVWQNTGTAAAPVWTAVPNSNEIVLTTTPRTLLQKESGSDIILDKADGIVITLPAPVVGTTFTFKAKTSVTSNAYKIITDAATTFLLGSVIVTKASDGTMLACFADGSTHVALNMAGTTKGGLKGTSVKFTCITTTLWVVEGFDLGSGTIETPFATS